jgi:hypothetical protein
MLRIYAPHAYGALFPIPFPTNYFWTSGQGAAEVAVAHIIVLRTVDPLKNMLYYSLGGVLSTMCNMFGLREFLMPIAAKAQVGQASASASIADGENAAPLDAGVSDGQAVARGGGEQEPALARVRGARPREPWQRWEAPDEADSEGRWYGYAQDPTTREVTRVLLAPRVRPHPCVLLLKLVCMFAAIWSFVILSVCLILLAIEVLIHLPVWALALPSFMFHAPACLLVVVYLGLWGRRSLNGFLEMKRDTWDRPLDDDPLPSDPVPSDLPPATTKGTTDQDQEFIPEPTVSAESAAVEFVDKSQEAVNSGDCKAADDSALAQKPFVTNRHKTLTLPETVVYLSSMVVVIVLWVWIPMVVGAACSRMSLRLQQIMMSSSEAQYEGHVDWTEPLNWLRIFRWDPESFAFGRNSFTPPRLFDGISRLFNIPNFFSGIWLLDVFFCLSEYGHENILSVVSLFVRIKRLRERQHTVYSTEGERKAREMRQLMPIVWEGLRLGLEVGIPAVGFLLLLECDALTGTFAATMFGSIAVSALLIERACVSMATVVDDQFDEHELNRNAFLEFAHAFHNDIRDARYRTGVKLANRMIDEKSPHLAKSVS